jgi:acyl-CoA thioesterase I
MNKLFLSLSLLLMAAAVALQAQVKVACVGNSITENRGIGQGQKYPDVLQNLLGDGFAVRNYGLGGRTLLKHGDKPYWNEAKYAEVLAWQPDVIIIKLGTNDSKPQNWQYKNEFVADYISLVESFKKLSSNPVVYVCLPVPVFEDKWGITESVVRNEVIPMVKQVAKNTHVKTIDLHTALSGQPQLFYDGIHPNADGCKIMATAIDAKIHKKLKRRKPFVGQ